MTEEAPKPLTAEQHAYQHSHMWVQRCCRDAISLHLQLDALKLIFWRMKDRLPQLRSILDVLQAHNAREGVPITEDLPDALRQERILSRFIYELEEHPLLPSHALLNYKEAYEKLREIKPTQVRARVTMHENGAWEVHADRSELEPVAGGQSVDYFMASELLAPPKVEIPAYAIMTEVEK